MKLILASNSPRRKELLEKSGFLFDIISSDYEEQPFSNDPILTARTFAEGKAKDVFNKLSDKSEIVVLGADTVVYCDGKILGKPTDAEEARKTLKSLSGKTHEVATGYSIISAKNCASGVVVTKVTFNNLTEEVIEEYIKSGLYKGKAGSYGIQDGFPLVEKYEGSLSNVIGLPIEEVAPILKKLLNIK